MIVFAVKEGTVIWSDNNGTHKAGRVPLHQSLVVLSDSNPSWYSIARPSNLTLDADPKYPDYWVKRSDTTLVIVQDKPDLPDTPVDKVSNAQAAQAIMTLLRWWKDY